MIKLTKTNKKKMNGMNLYKVTGAKPNKYGGVTKGVWARTKTSARNKVLKYKN